MKKRWCWRRSSRKSVKSFIKLSICKSKSTWLKSTGTLQISLYMMKKNFIRSVTPSQRLNSLCIREKVKGKPIRFKKNWKLTCLNWMKWMLNMKVREEKWISSTRLISWRSMIISMSLDKIKGKTTMFWKAKIIYLKVLEVNWT